MNKCNHLVCAFGGTYCTERKCNVYVEDMGCINNGFNDDGQECCYYEDDRIDEDGEAV